MKSVGINYTKVEFRYAGQFRYVAKISLGSENFASLAKFHRDSEITKFRYALPNSLASEISLA